MDVRILSMLLLKTTVLCPHYTLL